MRTTRFNKGEPETPAEVSSLHRFAEQNHCWIYFEGDRKFYTPDEFLEQWKRLYKQEKTGFSNIKDFVVKNPFAAIRQRIEWVNKVNDELQSMLKKFEGYDMTFKPPK